MDPYGSQVHFAPPPRSEYRAPCTEKTKEQYLTKKNTKPPGTQSRTSAILFNGWLWELLAALFSFACIIAIIFVLRFEDGKQLDRWNLMISPNAVISFVGALAKSSFMLAIVEIISQLKWLHFNTRSRSLADISLFDESSRGPWGSAKLILCGNKRTFLACIAALVTIASLLVDPTLQLVFSFPSRPYLDISLAPSLHFLRVLDQNGYDPRISSNLFSTSTNSEMQASILTGLFSRMLPPDIDCPGTDCTWHNVTTLGICSSCQDVKQQVQMSCSTPFADGTTEGDLTWAGCNYTIDGNIKLAATWGGYEQYVESTLWNSTAMDLSSYFNDNYRYPPPFPPNKLRPELTAFASIKFRQGSYQSTLGTPAPQEAPPSEAYICGFEICAKTYDDISTGGTKPSLSPPHETQLLFKGVGPNMTDGRSLLELVPNNSAYIAPDTTFSVNQADYVTLGAYLTQLFTSGYESNQYLFRGPGGARLTGLVSPGVGRVLFESKNLTLTMQNVATSMTEYMRTSANSTTVTGQARVSKTFIHVNWGWLALPIALMVLTLVLLIVVILLTHRTKVTPWKSSALAMLFHDLDGWDRDSLGMRNHHLLHDSAKGMKARLYDGAGRLAFVKDD